MLGQTNSEGKKKEKKRKDITQKQWLLGIKWVATCCIHREIWMFGWSWSWYPLSEKKGSWWGMDQNSLPCFQTHGHNKYWNYSECKFIKVLILETCGDQLIDDPYVLISFFTYLCILWQLELWVYVKLVIAKNQLIVDMLMKNIDTIYVCNLRLRRLYWLITR